MYFRPAPQNIPNPRAVDGTWQAILPLCFADPTSSGLLPGAPAFTTPTVVTPTAVSGAALTTTFTIPAQYGYNNPTGPTSYTLSTAPQSWFYRFVGQPLDLTSPSAWSINPGLPPNSPVLNTWSIERFTGYLALSTAPLGLCKVAQQDCSILTRPFPTGDALPNVATDAWTLEAVVSFNMNTADTPVSLNQIGVGIYMTDTPVPNVVNPLNASLRVTLAGGLHFFTSLKMSGTTFQWCYESVNAATPLNVCGTAPSLLGSAAIAGVTGFTYGTFRIDHSPSELLQNNVTVSRPGRGSWRFGQRFLPGWPYSYTTWLSDEAVLRPNALGQYVFNPATAQIALVGVAGSSTLKSFGQVRSINFRRLIVDPPGPVLSFAATTTPTAQTQTVTTQASFTAASRLLFRASSSGSLGVGAWSATSTTPVVVPYSPALVWNASLWVEVAKLKRNGGVDNLGILPTNPLAGAVAADFNSNYGNDGIPNGVPGGPDITAAQYFVNMASHTTGSWWWVDFGISTAVKEIVIYNRYDQLWTLLDGVKVVLTDLPFQGQSNLNNGGPPFAGVFCEQSQIPPSIPFSSTYNGYPAAARFNCSYPTGLVGRYLYVLNGAGFALQLREVQVFASNSCPARTATQATQVPFSTCGAGAPYGSVCAHTCNAGYVPLSGAGTSTCNGDAWNDPPLVCVPVCPDLPAPDFAVACSQSIYSETFAAAGSVANAWVSLMENFPTLGPYLFWANSAMQINAPPGIFPLGIAAVTTSAAIAAWSGAYSISVNLFTSDVAGLVWEEVDPQNFYRLNLDVVSQTYVVERMFMSAIYRLTVVFPGPGVPAIAANTWIAVQVSVDNGKFSVFINGNLLTTVSDTAIATSTGQVGVSSHSSAQFDNFVFSTACPNDCSGATDQSKCTFTCASGLLAVGLSDSVGGSTGTRKCVASGAVASWVPAPQVAGGVDMYCTLAAPFFPAATLSVAELSPQNTLVGNPLTATITSPDYTVLFAITGGANASTFYIDSCSGQVKVRQATIDFNVQPQYVLNVTASVADFPMTTTTQQIVVNVIEVDWAPVVLPATFLLPENPPAGTVVGQVPFFDHNGDNVTFSLYTDGASGRFVVLPSGAIVVAANLSLNSIDFETQALPFSLVIQVTETSAIRKPTASGLSSTGKVFISLTDQDDPPVPTAGQLLWVTEAAVNTGGGAPTSRVWPG